MNKTVKGGDLMIFVGEGAEKKSIAVATSHALSLSMETKDTSSKDNAGGWATSEAGTLSWTMKSENICSTGGAGLTYDDIVDLMIAREPVEVVMGRKKEEATDVPDNGWTPGTEGRKGKAFITNIEQNAPNGDNATFTVDFTGTGSLEKVNAPAANKVNAPAAE